MNSKNSFSTSQDLYIAFESIFILYKCSFILHCLDILNTFLYNLIHDSQDPAANNHIFLTRLQTSDFTGNSILFWRSYCIAIFRPLYFLSKLNCAYLSKALISTQKMLIILSMRYKQMCYIFQRIIMALYSIGCSGELVICLDFPKIYYLNTSFIMDSNTI